jgi:hypothetical protein
LRSIASNILTEAPSFRQLDQIEEERVRVQQNLEQSEIALTESLKALIGSAVPISDNLAKTFVKAATASLVKTAMKAVFPKGVDDIASARDWMNSLLAGWTVLNGPGADRGRGLLSWSDSDPPEKRPEAETLPVPPEGLRSSGLASGGQSVAREERSVEIPSTNRSEPTPRVEPRPGKPPRIKPRVRVIPRR